MTITSADRFAGQGVTSGSGTDWTTPNNIGADDGNYASADFAGTMKLLMANNFQLNGVVPANAILRQITASVKLVTDTGITGIRLSLGDTSHATNYITQSGPIAPEAWVSFTFDIASLGGTWGTDIPDLTAVDFGFRFDVTTGSGGKQVFINAMKASVVYDLPIASQAILII